MKSLALIIITLTLSFFLFGCQVANESNINSPNNSLEKKPTKGEKSEMITFTGDLAGSGVVEGCCPNAGPYPEYTMTLSGPLPAGTYDGNIFMNTFGMGKNKSYFFQFWWTEFGDKYFIEISEGVIQKDKRNKTLTATFSNAPCEIWIDEVFTERVTVNFVLTKAPQ